MANRFYGEFDFEHLPGKRPADDYRTPFQIDRDRILFSTPFRQLQSKTQVFQSGEYDFYRTRLTHTIEVARIARSITEYLNQTSDRLRPDFHIDADLVEAIGLAHDLGHPPFGHIGERKLNQLMREHGGFEGNAQTVRILTERIYERPLKPSGMRPTRALLDGVMKYKELHAEACAALGKPPANHFLYDSQEPYRTFVFDGRAPDGAVNAIKSIECQIMDWADDTAYSLHDIVDGVKARFITVDRLAQWSEQQDDLTPYQVNVLEEMMNEIRSGGYEPRSSQRIGQFIQACSLELNEDFLSDLTNRHRFRLHVDPRVSEVCTLHKRIAFDLIFRSPPLQQIEFKGGFLLEQLFNGYCRHYIDGGEGALRILPEPANTWIAQVEDRSTRMRLLCDHLANLTDALAVRTYMRLFQPDFGSIIDFA